MATSANRRYNLSKKERAFTSSRYSVRSAAHFCKSIPHKLLIIPAARRRDSSGSSKPLRSWNLMTSFPQSSLHLNTRNLSSGSLQLRPEIFPTRWWSVFHLHPAGWIRVLAKLNTDTVVSGVERMTCVVVVVICRPLFCRINMLRSWSPEDEKYGDADTKYEKIQRSKQQ